MKKIYIAESRVHGKGVHAASNIQKGETVFIIKGTQKKLIVKSEKDSKIGPHWVGIKKNFWIDPFPPARFLNHSCQPNAGLSGKVTVKALRSIKKNEEITIDYSTTEIDEHWKLKCTCKSKRCRKTIRSIQFLPKNIFRKYLPLVPTYFQRVYLEYNKS